MRLIDKVDIHIRKWLLDVGWDSRVLPDFLIIGAQKSGTTTLYNCISNYTTNFIHPYRKEIHFFDHNYHEGINWYKAHFPKEERINKIQVTGEATPYYMFHPDCPRRVSKWMPNGKLIAMLRDPVTRAYSHYKFQNLKNHTSARDPLPFNKAIQQEAERLAGEKKKLVEDHSYRSYNYQYYSYLNRGIYHRQLKNWFRYFDRSQFYIIKSESFFNDPVPILSNLFEWLHLQESGLAQFESRVFNKTHYNSMSRKTRHWLENYFTPHNKKLADLLGEEFNWKYNS